MNSFQKANRTLVVNRRKYYSSHDYLFTYFQGVFRPGLACGMGWVINNKIVC